MPLQIHRITGVKSVPVLLFAWLIFSQAKTYMAAYYQYKNPIFLDEQYCFSEFRVIR
jgi:succinate dehydrogenase/fumarate reductase cytochrome b subunit